MKFVKSGLEAIRSGYTKKEYIPNNLDYETIRSKYKHRDVMIENRPNVVGFTVYSKTFRAKYGRLELRLR